MFERSYRYNGETVTNQQVLDAINSSIVLGLRTADGTVLTPGAAISAGTYYLTVGGTYETEEASAKITTSGSYAYIVEKATVEVTWNDSESYTYGDKLPIPSIEGLTAGTDYVISYTTADGDTISASEMENPMQAATLLP